MHGSSRGQMQGRHPWKSKVLLDRVRTSCTLQEQDEERMHVGALQQQAADAGAMEE